MTRYIIRRLLGMVPTLLLLVFAVVLFGRMAPTDVIDIILQDQATDANTRASLEHQLGLDRSLPETYLDYVGDAVTGDLGRSLLNNRPVRELIMDRINVTVELGLYALTLGWLMGVVVGIVSAVKQDGPVDYLLRSVAIIGLTIPNFALATAVVILPAIYWQWSPPLSYTPWSVSIWDHVSQFILPSIVLAIALMGTIMRVTRTQMLEVMRQDYIRTARVKGLPNWKVISRHAVRNAMIPVISVAGLQIAIIVSGSVVIEQIFGLPGMGTLLIQSVNQKDWPIVQGVTLVIGVTIVMVNLLVDLSYGFIDPRIKVGG